MYVAIYCAVLIQESTLFSHLHQDQQVSALILCMVITYGPYFCFIALEDDTDELLELIATSDGLLTPAKLHHRTPGVLMNKSLGSSPYNRNIHSSDSHSSSDLDSDRSTQFSDEAEAYTDLKVKGNFTPAPVITHSNQPHLNKLVPPNIVPSALKELVELMQG